MNDQLLLAESYEAAADYLEQHGWIRHNLFIYGDSSRFIERARQEKPSACAMGAGLAVGVQPFQQPWGFTIPDYNKFSTITVDKWCAPLEAEIGTTIPEWNDDVAKNVSEVVDLLRMTALKIRMGDIGDNPKEYEFEPMPTTEPVKEPAAPQPVKEPQPA